MKPTEKVSRLINNLTSDEDQRQELWLHYLSGNSASSFASFLDKIQREYTLEMELQKFLWLVSDSPPSERFEQLLTNFSAIERSVVCLLALGLKVSEISRYKGISDIRIRQVIAIIKENECWEELYGIKEKLNG